MQDDRKDDLTLTKETPAASEQTEPITEEKIDNILRKFDKESTYRKLPKPLHNLFYASACIFTIVQFYFNVFGGPPTQIHRSFFYGFILFFAYLLYPARKGHDKIAWYDYVLAVTALLVASYWPLNYNALLMRLGENTTLDVVVGIIAIILSLECTRRVIGVPLVVVAILFLAYAYFGPYLPAGFMHRGFSIERISVHMFYTTEGVLGMPIGVMSTFVFMFIVFASFLSSTGIGEFFVDFANSIVGQATAGPAKVAVITSALLGTLSGSSVANVVGTGSFTIPLMKKMGYRPSFAGAVEAAASTGGQLMPPIMGSAAFLMSEIIGVSYFSIVICAVLPSLLYFTGIYLGVEFEGRRLGLKGYEKGTTPKLSHVMLTKGYLMMPLIGIIYTLVIGMTVTRAALVGTILAIACTFVKRSTWMTPKTFCDSLVSAGRTAIGLGAVGCTSGIVIGIIALSGVGLKLTEAVVSVAGQSLFITMFLTMIASLILGMGIPTTANYLITSTVAAPVLIRFGVPVMAAHLFVFYFGLIADLTPPVAVAAFAGAGIAGADPIKTGFQATKLAIAAFIVPYLFVYNTSLLMIDVSLIEAVRVFFTSIIGMVAISSSVSGWFYEHEKWYERILGFIGGLLLIEASWETDIIGIVIVALALGPQYLKHRRQVREKAASSSAAR